MKKGFRVPFRVKGKDDDKRPRVIALAPYPSPEKPNALTYKKGGCS